MRAKPRLLFLCQTLPYPPDGGVNIRAYHVLRLLAREFRVTALCFFRRDDRVSREAVEGGVAGLRPFGEIEAFPIPQEYAVTRLVWDHLRSVVRRRAYTVYTYESRPFQARLGALLRQRFDLVHMDSLDLAGYLDRLEGTPVICTHQNIESSLLHRRAAGERSVLRRTYLSWQAGQLANLEREWCERVALNVTVSDKDAHDLRRLAPRAHIAVVPNGVDVEAFRPEAGADNGLVFVGGANWFPNRDALVYFSEEILPLIQKSRGNLGVRWVGRGTERDREHFRDRYGIEVVGYVADVRPYIRDAACYVVPLRVGGGTRLKVLDAWAMGKAVVSTSIGCEGLAAVNGLNILIRDDPAGFADAVRAVLSDPALRGALGREARATVERAYSWEVIGGEMMCMYRSILEPRQPVSVLLNT